MAHIYCYCGATYTTVFVLLLAECSGVLCVNYCLTEFSTVFGWWTMTSPGDRAMMRNFDYRIDRDGGGCLVIMAGNVNVNILGDN